MSRRDEARPRETDRPARSPRAGALATVCWLALACLGGCGGGDVRPDCTSDSDCGPAQVCSGPPATTSGACTPGSRGDGGAGDGGIHTDGGVGMDGGGPADGGAEPDGGILTDGGAELDGGPAADGGLTDAGADGGSADGGSAGAGQTCQTAIALGTGTRDDSTVGSTSRYLASGPDPSCGGDGPVRVYSVTVPAGQRLLASVEPLPQDGGAARFDPSLFIVTGPASSCDATPLHCAAADDEGDAARLNTVAVTNTGAADVQLFVLVGSFLGEPANGLEPAGPFRLTTTVGAPPPGESCATAVPLGTGAILPSETTVGFARDHAGLASDSCPSASGADKVYALSVPAGQRLRATLTPAPGFAPVAYLVAAPAANCALPIPQCLASSLAATDGSAALTWANDGNTPAAVFLVVGSDSGPGGYALAAITEPMPAGDGCANAEVLVPTATSASVAGSTRGYSANHAGGGAGCLPGSGLDRVYSVVVPDGQRLEVSVTPALADGGAQYNPAVSLVAGPASACSGQPTCLAADDSGSATTTNRVFHTNRTGAPREVFVIVGSGQGRADSGGDYTLRHALTTPPAGQAGDGCPNALELTPGTPLTAQTLAGFTNDHTGGAGTLSRCPTANAGPDRVYRVEVPAGQELTVTATPSTFLDVQLSLVADAPAGCELLPVSCLGGANGGAAGFAETARWANLGTTPRTIFVVLDTPFTTPVGTFTLLATLGSPTPGETCATALPITTSGTLQGSTVGASNDYNALFATGCVALGGGDRVYRVEVPAGQRLTASVRPTDGIPFDPSLNLVVGPAASCEAVPLTCAASDDSGSAAAVNTVRYDNRAAAPVTVFVLVDTYQEASLGGTFELTTSLEATPETGRGEGCADAVPLAGPGTLTGQTTVGYQNNLQVAAPPGSCTGYGTAGPDRVYSIAVPAGQMLTATVTPTGEGDPAVYLVAGPATRCESAPVPCLAGDDSGPASAANAASYANSTAVEMTVFVVIDSVSAPVSSFTLTTALAPR